MGFGYVTNDPKKSVVFAYELSADGYSALDRLCAFYKEDPSKVIDRMLIEKNASLLSR